MECRERSARLEKANFRLAMALTAALTLLGERAVRAVAGMVSAVDGVVAGGTAADGVVATPEEADVAHAGGPSDTYHFGGSGGSWPGFSGWEGSSRGGLEAAGAGFVVAGVDHDFWSPAVGFGAVPSAPGLVPADLRVQNLAPAGVEGILDLHPPGWWVPAADVTVGGSADRSGVVVPAPGAVSLVLVAGVFAGHRQPRWGG